MLAVRASRQCRHSVTSGVHDTCRCCSRTTTSCLAARRCQTGRHRQRTAPRHHTPRTAAKLHVLAVYQTPARRLLTQQHPRAALPPPLHKQQRPREAAHCRRAAPQQRPLTLWSRCGTEMCHICGVLNCSQLLCRKLVRQYVISMTTRAPSAHEAEDAAKVHPPECTQLCRLLRPAVQPLLQQRHPLQKRSSACRPRQTPLSRWSAKLENACSLCGVMASVCPSVGTNAGASV